MAQSRATSKESESAPISRDDHVARLRRETFDLAIIGAGITGAAVARDAAMRGMRVALIDKGDFAGATSSRSSKLIHGGLRYLPQGQLSLVYHALRERERLLHVTAPHLVRPIRFLLPIYAGSGFGRFSIAAGLFLYDLFARAPRAEHHRNLNARGVIALEPALGDDGLRGGALYSDGWGDDARITLENVLDAIFHGAAAANYVAIEALSKQGGRIAAAAARDLFSGESFELRAGCWINAAGPWVDDVRCMDDPDSSPSLRLTKGVHIVIARERLPVRESLVLSDDDGRIVFVMPHERYVLVGTTDTDFDGDRAAVSADRSDIDYLLSILRKRLRSVPVGATDVVSSFAGLRALIRTGAQAPSSVPREEMILHSRSGMISVAGGKLTTHREIAQKIVDHVMRKFAGRRASCPTLDAPLPGARPSAGAPPEIAPELYALLTRRYGSRAVLPARLIAERPELGAPLAPGCPALGAEVIHAVRYEMASSLRDFLVRRTAMVWRWPLEAERAAPAAARLMAAELGWDRSREETETAAFNADLSRRRAAA